MGTRAKRPAAEDPAASSSRAPADPMHGRSLDDLPEEALSNIAGRLMEFSPPFARECHAVRSSIGLASTCARLRRIVIAAWCQKLLGVPIDNLGKGKAKVKVKIDVSKEEVEVASLKQLQEWCQQMGLKKSGKKAELQQRVLSAQSQNPEATAGVPSELKRLISSQNRVRVTVTNAKKEYRVGEQELSMLPSEQRPNPIDPTYAPMRLYLVNDVLAAAKARFMGDAEWFRDSSRRAPKLTGEGLAALRQEMARRGQPVRRAQVERTLQTHGLDADKHRAAFLDYIQTGAGSLDMIVRAISTSGQPVREAALREALREAGLPEHHATSCQLFRAYLVNAQGKGPADLVPMLQRQLAYEASRLEAATAALAAAGLDPAHHLATDSFSTHIKSGAGSLPALVEAAQAAAARSAAATSALTAAGLNPADHMATEPFLAYVGSGAGVLDELVADAALDAARKRIAVKLVAAGLPGALAGAWELQPCVQAEVAMLHAAGAVRTSTAAAAQDAGEPAGQTAADGVQTDSNSGAAEAGVSSPAAAASAAALPKAAPAAAEAASPQPPAAEAAAAAAALGATLEALTTTAAAPLQRRAAAFAALQAARLLPVEVTEQGAGLEGAVLLEAPELQPYLMGVATAEPMDVAAVAGGSAAGEAAGTGVARAAAAEAPSSAAAEGMLQAAVQALAARLKAEGAAAQQRSKQQEPAKRAQQTAQQRQAAVAAAARATAAAHSPPPAVLLGQAAVKQEPEADMKGLGFKTEALHAQDIKQDAELPGGPSIKREADVKLEGEGDDVSDDGRKGQGHVSKRRVKQEPGRLARPKKQPGRRRHRRAAPPSESEEDHDVDIGSDEADEAEQEQEQEAVVAAAARRSVPKRGRKRKAEADGEQQQEEDDEEQVGHGAADEEAPRPAAKRAKGRTAAGMCACCGEGKATRQCQHSCCGDCCPGPCKRHGC